MSVTANHVVFTLSFAAAVFTCYFGSQFLGSAVDSAGYDIFGTILRLEEQPEQMYSQLLKNISSSQLAPLVTIALTVVTSVVIFLKFSKSTCGLVKRGNTMRLTHFPRVEATSAGSSKLARIPTHKKNYRLTEYCYVSYHTNTVLLKPSSDLRPAIDLACPVQMMSSACQLVNTSQSLPPSTTRKLCEAIHQRVVTMTSATSSC